VPPWTWDGGTPTDAWRRDGPVDCSEVLGFRKCEPLCPERCPDRIRCPSYIPLCLPRQDDPSCAYTVGGVDGGLYDFCDEDKPCLIPGEAPPDNGARGVCVPLELCLEGHDTGLPPFHCIWSDMTEVTRRPPRDPCPPAPAPNAPFCEGPCRPGMDCPEPSHYCVGRSDTRAFGVCSRDSIHCWEELFEHPSGRARLDDCSDAYGAPCACMLFFPQPEDAPFPRGVFTRASACTAYRDLCPGGVECRDASWEHVP